ncbi:MAG: hypothetical protein QOJ03_2966 [Frankiaceae bacterium]|jgi:hypothetical protein|nr:hypothetical protein [Frankiaceae bacterium]
MTDVTLMSEPESLTSGRQPPGLLGQGVGRRSRLAALADPASHLPTYAGVVIALIGFALIGVGWAKVAGLIDVWRQMPYLLSAGLPGLGLVMTGLVIINVSARRQDAAARARQTATLTEALRDLQRSLDR